MPHIDLNCDLGESFGAYTIGMDEKAVSYTHLCRTSLAVSALRIMRYCPERRKQNEHERKRGLR